MEYGASAEDVARVCHAHPVCFLFAFACLLLMMMFEGSTRFNLDIF